MPAEPSIQQVHIDQLLTDILVQYKNELYIADTLFPIVPVKNRSDIVPKYTQSAWFRSQARPRAAGAKSARIGFEVDTTQHYVCERYAIGYELPDEVRDNTDSPFDLDREGTTLVGDQLQLYRELNFATKFFTTSVWGQDKVGGTDFTQWSNYGGSSPLTDLTTYRTSILGLIGRTPNVFTMGQQLWDVLKWHPDIVDTIKYTQRAQVTQDIFSSLIEIPTVCIGTAISTSSPEGTAESDVTYSFVWGKNGLLMYSPGRPGLLQPAAGYTFVWQRVASAIQYIQRLRDQEREMDIIEANSYFSQNVIGANAGLFLSEAAA